MLLVNGIRKKFWLKIVKNNFHRSSRSVQYEKDKVGGGGLSSRDGFSWPL